MAKYSLANYIMTIKVPDELASVLMINGTSEISIGGTGSYLESITISMSSENLWDVQGDSTGSYVFNKNLNRTGTVQISLSMLSNNVALFKQLCNIYYSTEQDYDGLTISVNTLDGGFVAECTDCLPQGIPSQAFGSTAANQTWTFVCGKITFVDSE